MRLPKRLIEKPPAPAPKPERDHGLYEAMADVLNRLVKIQGSIKDEGPRPVRYDVDVTRGKDRLITGFSITPVYPTKH